MRTVRIPAHPFGLRTEPALSPAEPRIGVPITVAREPDRSVRIVRESESADHPGPLAPESPVARPGCTVARASREGGMREYRILAYRAQDAPWRFRAHRPGDSRTD